MEHPTGTSSNIPSPPALAAPPGPCTRCSRASAEDFASHHEPCSHMAQPSFVSHAVTWPESIHSIPLGASPTQLDPYRTPYTQGEVSHQIVKGDHHQYPGEWSGFRQYNPAFAPYHQHHDPSPVCFHHPRQDGHAVNIDPSQSFHTAAPPPPPPVPTPPASEGSPNTEWVSFMKPEHEAQPSPKRIRRANPFDASTFVARSDGVRKKNAKFEIPEERNLDTLDAMIKEAKTDGELKELKMQKRLLRNRDAALHSRQKKKMHTEKLEDENKLLVAKINQFQHRITGLQIKIDDHEKEREDWQERQTKAEEQLRRLQADKDAQAKENARLAGELAQLRSQVRSTNSSTPATSRTSMSGYSECTSELNNCTLDNAEWQDGYDCLDDMCFEAGVPAAKTEASTAGVGLH